uniref:Uncharacterized protein n=1 Tax=Romanomermis culicivorax TaxID=13658 RepID=A0A915I166_ROMCU
MEVNIGRLFLAYPVKGYENIRMFKYTTKIQKTASVATLNVFKHVENFWKMKKILGSVLIRKDAFWCILEGQSPENFAPSLNSAAPFAVPQA